MWSSFCLELARGSLPVREGTAIKGEVRREGGREGRRGGGEKEGEGGRKKRREGREREGG